MKLSQLRRGYQVWHGENYVTTYEYLEPAKAHIFFHKEDGDNTPWYIVHIKDYEFIHQQYTL